MNKDLNKLGMESALLKTFHRPLASLIRDTESTEYFKLSICREIPANKKGYAYDRLIINIYALLIACAP